mmetsp:Transcript_21768/g.58133  ORF Transcript_21768/g.58133 Transcript_21768/m.58133 type:complete len:205 (-) Transcript_21768:427-1041(-)
MKRKVVVEAIAPYVEVPAPVRRKLLRAVGVSFIQHDMRPVGKALVAYRLRHVRHNVGGGVMRTRRHFHADIEEPSTRVDKRLHAVRVIPLAGVERGNVTGHGILSGPLNAKDDPISRSSRHGEPALRDSIETSLELLQLRLVINGKMDVIQFQVDCFCDSPNNGHDGCKMKIKSEANVQVDTPSKKAKGRCKLHGLWRPSCYSN